MSTGDKSKPYFDSHSKLFGNKMKFSIKNDPLSSAEAFNCLTAADKKRENAPAE